jgi:DNA-binding Lrp family transcriptional regulator
VGVDQPRQPSRLDETDLKILGLLQADARQSARALGREIGMSPGAVSERITRLERDGVIRGYHADIDSAALGYDLRVVIGLQMQQGASLAETLDHLLGLDEVLDVHVVTGRWDLMMVAHATDQRHLREFLVGEIWSLPAFRHGETMLVLDSRSRGPAGSLGLTS